MKEYFEKHLGRVKKIVHLKAFTPKQIVHSIANNSSKEKLSFGKGELIRTNTVPSKAMGTFKGNHFD
jgi:hypothetical protein